MTKEQMRSKFRHSPATPWHSVGGCFVILRSRAVEFAVLSALGATLRSEPQVRSMMIIRPSATRTVAAEIRHS
jgi:hypothetical protein